jgi:flagellar motor protein MotB
MPIATRVGLLVVMMWPLLVGCTQPGSASGPTFPWQRQVPPGANSQAWLSDLQRRADEQARFADQQQQRVAQLRELQRQQDRQSQLTLDQRARREQDVARQQQQTLSRYRELESRATDLDYTNRDMHAELARAQQRSQVLEDELTVLRGQLNETTQQLADVRRDRQLVEERLQTLQASARRKGGASITANSSLEREITAVMVPGMDIRQDGDLVRISLPADKLFVTGTATLHQGAQPYVDQVAEVILRHYPRQIVGVEAHTDQTAPATGTLWRNQHQLTAAQAMALFEQLTYRHRIPARQLFVLGHGGNHPLASDGTTQGQALNRRVEIVVYPELYAER